MSNRNYDVVKQPGAQGQNSPDPESLFTNHVIAYINGQYYDPSYGKTYASLADMASQAVAGFFNWVVRFQSIEVQKESVSPDYLVQKPEWTLTWLPGVNSPGAMPPPEGVLAVQQPRTGILLDHGQQLHRQHERQ